jgi:hypothetical protein
LLSSPLGKRQPVPIDEAEQLPELVRLRLPVERLQIQLLGLPGVSVDPMASFPADVSLTAEVTDATASPEFNLR